MSRNIRVSSSRIIPGRSILINSNHQSSNMEGKRRNLCTFLFSLSLSLFLFLFLSDETRVHTRALSTSIYLGSFLTPIRPRIPLFRPFCFKPVLAFPHKRRSLELCFRCTCAFIPSILLSIPSCTSSISSLSKSGYFLFHEGFLFESFEVHDDWPGNGERG